jgi:hypothetical protein
MYFPIDLRLIDLIADSVPDTIHKSRIMEAIIVLTGSCDCSFQALS